MRVKGEFESIDVSRTRKRRELSQDRSTCCKWLAVSADRDGVCVHLSIRRIRSSRTHSQVLRPRVGGSVIRR